MKNTSIKLALLFFILINMTLISCYEYSFNESANNKYVTELKFNSKEFCENKTKWETNKPQNYRFDYEVDLGSSGLSIYVTSVVEKGQFIKSIYKIGEKIKTIEEITEDKGEDVKDSLQELKLETIDDFIIFMEERIAELNSVDYEEEKFTKYELKVFYNSDFYFPYDYEIHYSSDKETPLVECDSDEIIGEIYNFKILEEQAL